MVELLDDIKKHIEAWRNHVPKQLDYTVQISELPLASPNLYPQIFHTILQNPTDPALDPLIPEEPKIL